MSRLSRRAMYSLHSNRLVATDNKSRDDQAFSLVLWSELPAKIGDALPLFSPGKNFISLLKNNQNFISLILVKKLKKEKISLSISKLT